jgi:GAF domain-containing protein
MSGSDDSVLGHWAGGDGPLGVVQALAERLAAAQDVESVATAVASGASEALEVSAVMVGVTEAEGKVRPLVSVGLAESSRPLVSAPFAAAPGMPAHTVLDSGEPVFWSSVRERDRDYPGYAGYPTEHGAWAILPLLSGDRAVGILALAWPTPREFGPTEAGLLRVVAHQCAVALDRAQLLAAEREARELSDLLADGTRLMSSALDSDEILRRLVGLAVPALAPWCAVYVEDGGVLTRIALEIASATSLAGKVAKFPTAPLDGSSPLADAYRTGEVRYVPDVTREDITAVYPDDLADEMLATARGARLSALVVPAKVSGRVIGVMSLVSGAWARSPGDSVLRTAEGLAARAGMALSIAGRYQQEHETAVVLTKALLPSDAAIVPGLDIASRYLPAAGSVAGDWFDVVAVSPGRHLLGVGDSAGHDIEAASLMASLRNAARGLAVGGAAPAEVLSGLDWLVRETVPEGFATAQYMIAEAGAGTVVLSSAGHLPPVLFDLSGAWLLDVSGTALGVPPGGSPVVDLNLDFPPGSGLVLYTDGVVERRRFDLALQLERIRELVAACCTEKAETIADVVVSELCREPEDDCCLLVVRNVAW